jgi:hypothetical protein
MEKIWIRVPEWKKFASRINIPDPQHCIYPLDPKEDTVSVPLYFELRKQNIQIVGQQSLNGLFMQTDTHRE